MEETLYLMKARTEWTYAYMFQDENFWDDSLKDDTVTREVKREDEKPTSRSTDVLKEDQCVEIDATCSECLCVDNALPAETASTSAYVIHGRMEDSTEIETTSAVQTINTRGTRNSTSSNKVLNQLNQGMCSGIYQDDNDCYAEINSNYKHVTSTDNFVSHIDIQNVQDQQGVNNDLSVSTTTTTSKHVCNVCGKEFSHRSQLQIHFRKHTGEKPFECEHCNKRFSNKSNLTTHLHIHNGDKPFACGQCNYSSSHQSNLKKHLRIHSGEKPYSCTQCSYSCIQKGDLHKHMRTHSGEKPFECEHCNRRFSEKSNLTTHLHIHKGDKPFACSHCSFSSSRKGNLETHMRTHTDEKPFACGQCQWKF